MDQYSQLDAKITSLENQETVNATDIQSALTALKNEAPQDLQPAIDRISAVVANMQTADASAEAATAPPSTPSTGSTTPPASSAPFIGGSSGRQHPRGRLRRHFTAHPAPSTPGAGTTSPATAPPSTPGSGTTDTSNGTGTSTPPAGGAGSGSAGP